MMVVLVVILVLIVVAAAVAFVVVVVVVRDAADLLLDLAHLHPAGPSQRQCIGRHIVPTRDVLAHVVWARGFYTDWVLYIHACTHPPMQTNQ